MTLKGLDVLQAHLSQAGSTTGVWKFVLEFGALFAATCIFFLAADRGFAEWMPDGEIVVLALGFLVLSRFFSQRKAYQQTFGTLAYPSAMARFLIPGLAITTASVVHLGYIAGPEIPNVPWKPWLIALGWLLVAFAVVLWFRSVLALGLDNVLMVYVYFPAESIQMNESIYRLIRHPIYAASLAVGWGLALIHANWYALLVAVLLPIFYLGWVRLFEEPELMQRFPDYATYRKRVPAFVPRLADLGRLGRWLIMGSI